MHTVLIILLTLISIYIVGTHGVVGRRHFVSANMPPAAKLVIAAASLALIVSMLLLWTSNPPIPAMFVGIVLEALSLWLFYASIAASREARLRFVFTTETPDSIVTTGPYRVVRHPFYTSYLIFWTGLAIGTWTPWAIAVLALMVLLYTIAARGEERKFINSPLAQTYAEYRARAGMFWPKPGAKKKGGTEPAS